MEMVSVKRAPRVSVLMTVYNSEKYLAEAIESILAQTAQPENLGTKFFSKFSPRFDL